MEQRLSLKNLLPSGRYQWMVYICCLMVFIGFSCSRAVISIGVIGLIMTGLVAHDIRRTSAILIHRPSFYINALFFLVILLSGLNSTDSHQWHIFLQIKIPFLLLPFAFCAYTFIDRSLFNKILLAFALCMMVSAACVMVNYMMHYQAITEWILSGGIIPVPFSHIRYTLLLVFAFFSLIWLWEQWRVHLLLLPALFFAIVIHVLSSRSAWLAFYAGLLFYFVVYVYRSRRYTLGLLMLLCIMAMPFALYQVIPSFRNKVGFTRYSMNEYHAGHIDDMSDAMRISSWYTGIEIIKRHPWFGTGAGDLLKESKQVSKELFPNIHNDDDRKMPHNEFIWIWAATGVFGFIAYCIAFFLPLAANIKYKNWLFAVFYIIFLTSFMTEDSIEEQIGSTFYLVFLLIFLAHFNYRPAAHD